MYNVLLVEDSKITSEAITSALTRTGRYNVTMTIENAANAEIACLKGGVDLILMDVCTAEDESGIAAAEKIKHLYPNIRIVIMTSMPEHSFIRMAKATGCDSFWYKEFGSEDIIDVCDKTMNGESVYPTESPVIPIGTTDSSKLTSREIEVICLLAAGYKHSEISAKLFISENTVKFHIKKLLQKTGYTSTIPLIVDVVESRLVLPTFTKNNSENMRKD